MRSGSRLLMTAFVAVLATASMPLAAQTAPESNSPAPDTVGPRELQNFSLSGTVTRPADTPAAPAPRRATARPAPTVAQSQVPERREPKAKPAPEPKTVRSAPSAAPPPAAATQAPPIEAAPVSSAASSPAVVDFPPPAADVSHDTLPFLPWLFAAGLLGAGAAFLLWRRRSHALAAGGPSLDAFAAPQPESPQVRPSPPPVPPPPLPRAPAPAPAPPAGLGIVSSGLRGWLDIAMSPTRCIVGEEQVLFEFDLELYNSGSAAVRSILIEATMVNAGANQDREIAAFFGKPPSRGERLEIIGPLKRVSLGTQVSMSLEHVRSMPVGERQVFVPLLLFNVHYRAASSEGQTSVGYLVGRNGEGQKLAPLRLDLGPRLFRGLGARLLPASVRT